MSIMPLSAIIRVLKNMLCFEQIINYALVSSKIENSLVWLTHLISTLNRYGWLHIPWRRYLWGTILKHLDWSPATERYEKSNVIYCYKFITTTFISLHISAEPLKMPQIYIYQLFRSVFSSIMNLLFTTFWRIKIQEFTFRKYLEWQLVEKTLNG